jgi:hypothetical protein
MAVKKSVKLIFVALGTTKRQKQLGEAHPIWMSSPNCENCGLLNIGWDVYPITLILP